MWKRSDSQITADVWVSHLYYKPPQNLEPISFFSFLFTNWLWWFFVSCFSSMSFDSVILLLIVSAGQLTKMAALPLWITVTISLQQKNRWGKQQGEIKYYTHPSRREVPGLYYTLFFLLFLSRCPQSGWKEHDNLFCWRSMARDNVVIIITQGTGWGSDRVSLGPLKHTHIHIFSAGKECF